MAPMSPTVPRGTPFAQRLAEVRRRIEAAATAAGRRSEEITLVAVTKTFAPAEILPAIKAGLRVFGENRVQEAKSKWPDLKARWPDIELHLVGPLQTNKAADAVSLFDCIESFDRPKLALALANEMSRQGRRPRLFVQVNTGAEPQKAGILPEDADRFFSECRKSHGLAISGLMCVPPIDEEPALHFALLEKIARRNGIDNLSMGMSADFETAIALGATHIRLGTVLFGERQTKRP